jgi:hypothetical protein
MSGRYYNLPDPDRRAVIPETSLLLATIRVHRLPRLAGATIISDVQSCLSLANHQHNGRPRILCHNRRQDSHRFPILSTGPSGLSL